MEDIKVNDYVRTEDGNIGKIEQINKEPTDDNIIYTVTDNWVGMYEEIVKHSPNIIDLIEVGDYVNELLITAIYDEYKNDGCIKFETNYEGRYRCYIDEDIKSIVTKEMFNGVKYEV